MRWLSAQGTRLSQPQGAARVDWGNPIARGLEFVGVGTRGGLLLAKGGPQSVAVAPSRAGRSGVGPYVSSPGGTTPICQTGATGVTGSDYSLFAFGTLPSAATVRAAIDDDLDTGSPRCFQFRVNAGKVELITFNTGGTPYFATGATLTAAQLAAGVAMAAVVAGNQIASFANGRKTSATASGTQRVPTGNFYVGQHKGTGANGWDGELVLVGTWSRALSDAEVASLSANPWQLFAPERRIWVPVVAGGGSSTNLVIQSALHAHAADGPTLTTDSTLAIAEALHAHSADAPTLSTDLLLSVADALHGHAVESLTLDTGVALAVADATHGHTADGLTLVTDSALAVADALHAHTADNLTLTADGAVDLVIQDALHGHTADELTLSATGAGGYYDDDPKRASRKREKLTVVHKDDSDERSQEFEALLARVKGQALDKAKQAAQAAPVATPPADIKPPRMPEIRGVEAAALRQWMPDLLSTYREQYRAAYVAELQALASAQQAAAQAQWARQIDEDEEIALLAMLA